MAEPEENEPERQELLQRLEKFLMSEIGKQVTSPTMTRLCFCAVFLQHFAVEEHDGTFCPIALPVHPFARDIFERELLPLIEKSVQTKKERFDILVDLFGRLWNSTAVKLKGMQIPQEKRFAGQMYEVD